MRFFKCSTLGRCTPTDQSAPLGLAATNEHVPGQVNWLNLATSDLRTSGTCDPSRRSEVLRMSLRMVFEECLGCFMLFLVDLS